MNITITQIVYFYDRHKTKNSSFPFDFFLRKMQLNRSKMKNWMKFTEKNINKPDRKIIGRTLSTASTSFENRFNIRPNGVVSNKPIGQWSTCFNNISCISCAEKMKLIDSVIDDVNIKKAMKINKERETGEGKKIW